MRVKRKILSFIRRVVGTQQLQQPQQPQQQQRQQLLALGNGLKYFFTDPEAVKDTSTYQRCTQIISLLAPMDVEGAKYSRVGQDFDGGYVMLEDFDADSVDAAYSFGIADDVSWDEAIANRCIDVFMYDHTIENLPREHPRFHYFKLGITGSNKADDLRTLEEILALNNHSTRTNLIMKMDIEGCEWDTFQIASSETIGQFRQIVIEFHDLIAAAYDPKALDKVLSVLGKINATHQSVHVHANSSGIPLWIGGLVLPDVLEVTFVRRENAKSKFVTSKRQFPTEIDQPTYQGGYDVYLGRFSCEPHLSELR